MKKLFILSVMALAISVSSCNTAPVLDSIDGMELTYSYKGWNSYHIKFAEEGMSYQFLNGSQPETWWGAFPYKMHVTDNNEYLISWFEEGYGDYITLLVDLEKKKLFGTGVVYAKGGVMTTFKEAVIKEIVIPE